MNSNHLDTSRRLAAHLRAQGYKCWVEAQRVGKWTFGDSPRVDVLAIRPWHGKDTEVIAFEVKVSTADLRRDLASGKWRAYYETLGIPRVVVACAHGVAPTVGEIPADLGLWVEGAKGDWKRKSLGRKMHGDLRKLDPLLLMWCLSMDGDQTSGTRYVETKSRIQRLRATVPESALKIIDAERTLRDDYMQRDLFERIGKKRGRMVAVKVHHLLYGKLEDIGGTIEKWATDVVRASALAAGVDPDEFIAKFQTGSYLVSDMDRITKAIEVGVRFKKESERVRRIADGLSNLAHGWMSEDKLDKELKDSENAATA